MGHSVKLVKSLMTVIDPDWKELGTDQLAEFEGLINDVIDAVEEHQATTQRLLVVGQIQHDGSEDVHTVALGPFGARGTLSDPAKFRKAAESSTAAHTSGGKLAWDVKTSKGRGKYMIVPLLKTPRDAWDFYRGTSDEDLPEELVKGIEASIRGPILNEILPTCVCGVRATSGYANVQGVPVTRKCFRHLGGN